MSTQLNSTNNKVNLNYFLDNNLFIELHTEFYFSFIGLSSESFKTHHTSHNTGLPLITM